MKCEQDQYKNGVGFDCELVHDATQAHVKKAHWIPKRTPEFRNDCYESPEKRLPCRRVTLQKKVPFATKKKVNRVDDVLVGDCESHFTHRSHPQVHSIQSARGSIDFGMVKSTSAGFHPSPGRLSVRDVVV